MKNHKEYYKRMRRIQLWILVVGIPLGTMLVIWVAKQGW